MLFCVYLYQQKERNDTYTPVINSFLETIPIYYPKYKTNKPYHKSDENQPLSNLALQPWRYNMRVNRCLLANF